MTDEGAAKNIRLLATLAATDRSWRSLYVQFYDMYNLFLYVNLGLSNVQAAHHGCLLFNHPAEPGETHGQQTGERKI